MEQSLARRDSVTSSLAFGGVPGVSHKAALAMLAASTPRLAAGNWMAEISQASVSTFGGSFKSGKQAFALGQAAETTEYQDCEPEFVRFNSIESEANSDFLARLFARKLTPQSRTPSTLQQVCEEDARVPFAKTTEHSFIPRCSRLDEGQSSSLLQTHQAADGTDAAVSPRASVDSAGSCQEVSTPRSCVEVESGPASRLFRGDSAASEAGSESEERFATESEARFGFGPDPTCAVDHLRWGQQSLQSILSTEPPPSQCEGEQGSSPRDILESSVLDLIADPVVKSKIMSLQLFTDVEVPVPCFTEEAQAEAQHVNEDGDRPATEGEGCDGDAPDTPCSREDSPPPLQRRFTGKRGSILADCWLTSEQRRYRSQGCSDENVEFDFDAFKRRRF